MPRWWPFRRETGDATSGRNPIVEAAHRRGLPVVSVNDPDELSIALAKAQAENGDLAGAERTFTAIAGSSRPAAAIAAFSLGLCRELHRDAAGARDAYQKAIASGEPDVVGQAALNLGNLLAADGQVTEAERWFETALRSGHEQAAPKAAFNLGGLLIDQGRLEEASTYLQRAIESNHPDESVGALLYQGVVWYRSGRLDEAEHAYEQVTRSGHPEFAPSAAASLADVRRRRTSIDRAPRIGTTLARGWDGVPWGSSTKAFRRRFPRAERHGDWWRTGVKRETFAGIEVNAVQYAFHHDKLYLVSLIPRTEDRDRLTAAAMEQFGQPSGENLAWTLGNVEIVVRGPGLALTITHNGFAAKRSKMER